MQNRGCSEMTQESEPQSSPLDKFRAQQPRQQPSQPPSSSLDLDRFHQINRSATLENPAGDPKQYAAYENVKGRPQTRLRIRRLTDVSMAPDYRLLSNVVFNDFGNEFTLWYPFMQVTVKGRNLQEVAEAIMNGTCPVIRDYDQREYPMPLKEGEPVIERIEINVADMERSQQQGKEEGTGRVLEMDKSRAEGRGGASR
jgi:hypothetical protein